MMLFFAILVGNRLFGRSKPGDHSRGQASADAWMTQHPGTILLGSMVAGAVVAIGAHHVLPIRWLGVPWITLAVGGALASTVRFLLGRRPPRVPG